MSRRFGALALASLLAACAAPAGSTEVEAIAPPVVAVDYSPAFDAVRHAEAAAYLADLEAARIAAEAAAQAAREAQEAAVTAERARKAQQARTAVERPPASAVAVHDRGDWPEALAGCESAGDTDGRDGYRINLNATSDSGKYLGAGQFSEPTHLSAGGDGDPRGETWGEQRATIVSWRAASNPYRQWPTCWPILVRQGIVAG